MVARCSAIVKEWQFLFKFFLWKNETIQLQSLLSNAMGRWWPDVQLSWKNDSSCSSFFCGRMKRFSCNRYWVMQWEDGGQMFSYCERMTVPVQVFVWKTKMVQLQLLLNNAMGRWPDVQLSRKNDSSCSSFFLWKNESIQLQWLLSNAMRSLMARCSATVVIE